MKNIFNQVLKTVIIYFIGFVIMYLINIINGLFKGSTIVWFMLQCCGLGVSGALFWYLLHHKTASIKRISFTGISKVFYKNLCIQLLTVCVFFVFLAVREMNGKHFTFGWYYDLLQRFISDEELISWLFYGTFPFLNVAFFMMLTIFFAAYNLAQFLFESRIRKI